MPLSLNFFCFGLGFSGALLSRRAQRDRTYGRVQGTSSREREGLSPLSFEDEEGVRRALADTSHLVSTIPPDENGDVVLRRYGDGDTLGSVAWLCYCSSLSVYGDHDGAIVTEQTLPALPLSERGTRRQTAEQHWQHFAQTHNAKLCVMRIAGIYGAGRSALTRLRDQADKPILRSKGVFNRIHVEDLATAVLCAAHHQAEGIFNICDDLPSKSHEPLLYAAELLNLKAPPLVSHEQARAQGLLSETAWSFHREHKRASNRKMKEELGVRLAYPDYRSGLRSLLIEQG